MSGTYLVPEPPSNLADIAREARVPSGQTFVRCHDRAIAADAFNDRYGKGGRFHFFDDRRSKVVPVIYAAETAAAAIFETIFHDVPLTAGAKRVAGHRLVRQSVSQVMITCPRDLLLVELHDPGLYALNLRPENLINTTRSHYPRTKVWAQEIHRQVDWAQGMIWMSARSNIHKSVMMFGDRISDVRLLPLPGSRQLDDFEGWQTVRKIGEEANIIVAAPPIPGYRSGVS